MDLEKFDFISGMTDRYAIKLITILNEHFDEFSNKLKKILRFI